MNRTLVYNLTERWQYKAIDAFEEVDNPDEWLPCPNCGLKPIVWEFNNGRSTACGCGEGTYKHHSIHAESVMSVVNRSATKVDATEYKVDELRDNWNHWVKTSEEVFKYNQIRETGKW